MRQEVLIILNEREATKARAAEALSQLLNANSITSSRIAVDENTVRIIQTRKPSVVVLDYLLGDLTTGLDLLSAIRSWDPIDQPHCFFLTDEPSLTVAVEAMRNGCLDYLSLDSTQALKKLTEQITNLVAAAEEKQASQKNPAVLFPSLTEIPASSKESSQMVRNAQTAARSKPALIVIHGPQGSGKHTLARALYAAAGAPGFLKECDLRSECGALESVFEDEQHATLNLAVGKNLSLLLSHVEEDNGSLLLAFAERAQELDLPADGNTSLVLVTTSDESVAKSWVRQYRHAQLIAVPSLSKRQEDIAPFIQRFTLDAAALLGSKVKPLSREIVEWLTTLNWPGELRQLRAVCMQILLNTDQHTHSNQEEFETARQLWESDHLRNDTNTLYTKQTMATALHRAQGDYRRAAARLGISTSLLESLLTKEVV